jgi:FtsP/CotA-like multicopper oxidase with cupredoxin domain
MSEGEQQFASTWGKTKVWGFGDWDTSRFPNRYPGARINATYGRPVMVRYHNELPHSVKTYKGFGIPEIATHLHNAHTPSESDGNPVNYIPSVRDVTEGHTSYRADKGRVYSFKDQHYPNIYAGGDPREALSSLWFHDHHIDFTAQNVVKGMVGCYTLFDAKDTGDENTGLRLPSGEFDVPVFLGDFVFDRDHQVVFDLFNSDGILGDKLCANGAIQPYFEVKQRRYRFRLYNNGPSRWYEMALYDGSSFIPFWQISNDGNLLPGALKVNSVRLSVAERADIIIDFGKLDPKKTYYLVNRMEQTDGRGPTFKLVTPGTGIVQFRPIAGTVRDLSADPAAGALGNMRELPDGLATLAAKLSDSKVKKRTFRFERSNGAWVVNGPLFEEDVVSANPAMGTEEIWTIQNPGGGWSHPVHIHYEEHRMLSRNGKAPSPTSGEYGRKDVIALGPNDEVKMFMRFRDLKGRFVMHCHNVLHEDSGMMVRWDIT